MPEVNLESVSYAYPDGYRALNSVTFAVGSGESVGLVGANGAGKSTLLFMLPGVLLPTDGQIMVLGQKVSKSTAPGLRQQVGLIFQDSDDQLFTQSVFEDVAFGPRNMNLSEAEVQSRARTALEVTGIAHLAIRAPYKLSGGEKKLAAIASVLAMQPRILVMDEPTASLDPRARRSIIHLTCRLEQTKLIASHDLDFIWDTCSRVIVLQNGAIAADGAAKDILSDAELMERCGLELPLRLQKE